MTGVEVDWHLPEDAHLCVYVCETCGQGFTREDGVDGHLDEDHGGAGSWWVSRVYLGTTLRWRPDTTEGFRCEVRALGHDGERPWLGLASDNGGAGPAPKDPNTPPYYWWVPFATYVDACFPADPWTVETPDVA